MSYDFKFMFVYHGTMMFLMIAGGALSVVIEAAIAAALLAVGAVLIVRHRRTTPWVWPGVSAARILGAAGAILLGGLFLFSAMPLSPPTRRAMQLRGCILPEPLYYATRR